MASSLKLTPSSSNCKTLIPHVGLKNDKTSTLLKSVRIRFSSYKPHSYNWPPLNSAKLTLMAKLFATNPTTSCSVM